MRFGEFVSTSSSDGDGVGRAISAGALYRKVNVPVTGGWSTAINVYATVYKPEMVSGLTPTINTEPWIWIDPSSTLIPFESLTVISFAPSNKSALALIVTAVGEMLNTDPAVGEVLTIEVAQEEGVAAHMIRSAVKSVQIRLITLPP